MWIIKPENLNFESYDKKLNVFYKKKNVFVMDNHLAAAWVWANNISQTETYSLIHIDKHYDLLDVPSLVNKYIIDKHISLTGLTIAQFLNLTDTENPRTNQQIFTWDNYILNFNLIYPRTFGDKLFFTHEDGNADYNFITSEYGFNVLFNELASIINSAKNKIILNIDIDYFFSNNYIQIFTDEIISELAIVVKKNIDRIHLITVALSPECCGGIQNSLKVFEIFNKNLELNLKLDIKSR